MFMTSHTSPVVPRFVVLCGPMGAGKSTVGRLLSLRLGWMHFDSDRALEAQFGLPLADVFRERGEPFFRMHEEDVVLAKLADMHPTVLSLGGGSLQSAAVQARCAEPDVALVWIRISAETAASRLGAESAEERPLWTARGIDGWRALFEAREEAWSSARFVVDTDRLDPEDVASEVVAMLQAHHVC